MVSKANAAADLESRTVSGPSPNSSAGMESAQIRLLVEGSVENLLGSWSDTFSLFPFSSRFDGSTIVHEYTHPVAIRYTINSLIGLLAAAASQKVDLSEASVRALAAAFLARPPDRPALPADRGLATLLHCELDADATTLRAQVGALAEVLARGDATTLNMQDAAWILWGAAAARRAGIPEATDVVRAAYRLITRELVDECTGLPRHSARRYRRDIVSFGSLTYFLRAMHEAAAALGEEEAQRLFDAGVARAIDLQGPRGEWPWMIDCRTATAFDFYPVFSVHQDSMAMLFLHPAVERGLPGASEAIGRSVEWVFGRNEVAQPMFVERPFFAYRSIERAERAPRIRRYARSLRHRISPSPAATGARRIGVNDECRSYHLGWILYVWSSPPNALEAPRKTKAAGMPQAAVQPLP
jgi:hypothetical protein